MPFPSAETVNLQPPVITAGDEKLCDDLQKETFKYFLHESNPANGLIATRRPVPGRRFGRAVASVSRLVAASSISRSLTNALKAGVRLYESRLAGSMAKRTHPHGSMGS